MSDFLHTLWRRHAALAEEAPAEGVPTAPLVQPRPRARFEPPDAPPLAGLEEAEARAIPPASTNAPSPVAPLPGSVVSATAPIDTIRPPATVPKGTPARQPKAPEPPHDPDGADATSPSASQPIDAAPPAEALPPPAPTRQVRLPLGSSRAEPLVPPETPALQLPQPPMRSAVSESVELTGPTPAVVRRPADSPRDGPPAADTSVRRSPPEPPGPIMQRPYEAADPLAPSPEIRPRQRGPEVPGPSTELATSDRQAVRTAEPVPPVIQVTIGRVEVRAVTPPRPAPPPIPVARPRAPTLSLDDYLKQRGEGRR